MTSNAVTTQLHDNHNEVRPNKIINDDTARSRAPQTRSVLGVINQNTAIGRKQPFRAAKQVSNTI